MSKPNTLRASLRVALSALGFGAIPIFTIIATGDGATLQGMLVFRYLLAIIGLGIVSGGVRALRIPPKSALSLLIVGGVAQALLTFAALSALRYLPAATVSFLFYTYPVWVTLIEAVTGAERLTRVRVGALVIAVAGLAIMIGSPFSAKLSLMGVALSLGAALIYAIYIPLIGKLQAGVAPAVASTWVVIGAALLIGTFGAVTRSIVPPASLVGWSAIVALALFSTVVSFILFLRGLAALGPVRTAIISTVEPFFTAILAAIFVAQPLTARTFAGGLLIVAAVVLINITHETVTPE
jgi:drug/metabolite transporter (DMT)-like permease